MMEKLRWVFAELPSAVDLVGHLRQQALLRDEANRARIVDQRGRLGSGSHAIQAGASLGHDKDFDDRPVPSTAPDIGAFQH